MSGYTNFAVIGAGNFGSFVIQQLLKDKAIGTVKEVTVLTRQVKYPTNNYVVHDVLSSTHWLWTQGIKDHRSRRRQGDSSRLFQRRLHQESPSRHARCHQYH